MSSSPPTSTSLTPPLLRSILSLYAPTLLAVYRQNPRLKDETRLADALADDAWRYEALVGRVRGRRRRAEGEGGDGGEGGDENGRGAGWLEKEGELDRVVGWKITHGTYRPFLPSLIRQNSPELVKSTTRSAFTTLHPTTTKVTGQAPTFPQAALGILTKALKGVGPATATLLLSIHDPHHIPFFSDELYAWLALGDVETGTGKGKGKLKLKYDVKEYRQLFDSWVALRDRWMGEGEGDAISAVDVEKVAYVLGHWDLVAVEERRKVFEGAGRKTDLEGGEKEEEEEEEAGLVEKADPEMLELDRREQVPLDDTQADPHSANTAAANPPKPARKGGKDGKKTQTLDKAAPSKTKEAATNKRPEPSDETSIRRSKRLKRT